MGSDQLRAGDVTVGAVINHQGFWVQVRSASFVASKHLMIFHAFEVEHPAIPHNFILGVSDLVTVQ